MINELAKRLGLTIKDIDANGYARTEQSFTYSFADGEYESNQLTLIIAKYSDDGLIINDIEVLPLCHSLMADSLVNH